MLPSPALQPSVQLDAIRTGVVLVLTRAFPTLLAVMVQVRAAAQRTVALLSNEVHGEAAFDAALLTRHLSVQITTFLPQQVQILPENALVTKKPACACAAGSRSCPAHCRPAEQRGAWGGRLRCCPAHQAPVGANHDIFAPASANLT